MSTMEIELNTINNGSEGTAIVGEETESKGFTGLDELLEQELKEDDSVGCLRVGDGSGDGSELALNYVVSNPPGATFYSAKEDVDTDNILDKELADALSNDEEDTGGHKLVHEEATTVEVPVMSSVVVSDIVTEEVIGVTEEVIDAGADEVEDKTSLDDMHYQDEKVEFAYNEEGNSEGLENEYENAELAETEDLCEEVEENEENTELAENQDECEEVAENDENAELAETQDAYEEIAEDEENVELAENQDAYQEIAEDEENAELAENQDAYEEIAEDEENAELAENQDACEEIVANVEESDELIENQDEEIAENEYDEYENEEFIENEDGNEEYENVGSLENEEIGESEQNEGENLESVEEEEYCDCPENEDESRTNLDVAECEMNDEVDAENVTDDTAMETEFGDEEQNLREARLPSENEDESGRLSDVAENEMETKVGSEVQVSDKVNLPPEIPPDDSTQIEVETKNTIEEQSASVKTSPQPSSNNVIYLVVQTKETNNKSNGDMDNESTATDSIVTTEAKCSETLTKTQCTRTDKQPTGKAVLTVGSSNEPKTIKGINKSIVIKTIKTKIVKNTTSTLSPKAGTTTTQCVSNELHNKEQRNVESEPKETKENNSEKPKEEIKKSDKKTKGKVIVPPTIKTKVWESRRSPRKQEKRVKKVAAAKKDSQEKKVNGNQKKRVMTKQHVEKEGKIDKTRGSIAAGSSKDEEKKIQFVAVKRKLEEMFRVSQEEDDLMIDEIKKMKMETLDVLTKINAEIKKIKSVFLERQ